MRCHEPFSWTGVGPPWAKASKTSSPEQNHARPSAGESVIYAIRMFGDPANSSPFPSNRNDARRRRTPWHASFLGILEAPPGFEPGMEVLQTSALPLGDGADREGRAQPRRPPATKKPAKAGLCRGRWREEDGAGNGIRTRDFDLGKVALYH